MAAFHLPYTLTWVLALISLMVSLVTAGPCVEIDIRTDVGLAEHHDGRMWYNHKRVCDESKNDNNGDTSFKCDDGYSLKYKTNNNPESGATAWLTYPGQDEVEVEMEKYDQQNQPGCAGGISIIQRIYEAYSIRAKI
ncbi:unnamed protein product [Penicillium manginii]